jgi:hypothetical protein
LSGAAKLTVHELGRDPGIRHQLGWFCWYHVSHAIGRVQYSALIPGRPETGLDIAMQSFLCHPTALRTRIDAPWSLGRTRLLYVGFILSLKHGLHVCICISLLGGPCQPCRWCTKSWKGQLDQPTQCSSSDANNGREFMNRENMIAAALRLSHHEGGGIQRAVFNHLDWRR